MLAFDIGANIGSKTRELLDAGYTKVVAVEPLAAPAYEFDSRVIWYKSLVSNSPGDRLIYPLDTLSTVETSFMTEGRFQGYKWDTPVWCQSTTIAHLIDAYGVPEYVKIDVEHHELSVLQGFPNPSSVPLVSFEWRSEAKFEAFRCVAHLLSIGYWKFAIQFEDAGVLPPTNWYNTSDLDREFDELCSKHTDAWGQIWARL